MANGSIRPMLRIVVLLTLIALLGIWYVIRPPGKTWADCDTPKGMLCVPKGP